MSLLSNKKILTTILLIYSSLSLSNSDKYINQCHSPGNVNTYKTKSDYGTGSLTITRKGDSTDSNFTSENTIQVELFDHLEHHKCVETPYNVTETVCENVDSNTANGLGNSTFYSFFDKRIPLQERSKIFSKYVEYDSIKYTKLEAAEIFIYELDHFTDSYGVYTWKDFVGIIKKIQSESTLEISFASSIISKYAQDNQESLGLISYPRAQYTISSGNSYLADIFDISLPRYRRDRKIETIKGIDQNLVSRVNNALYIYSKYRGTPKSWTEFVEIFQDLRNNDVISKEELNLITRIHSKTNQELLGLQVSARVCLPRKKTYYYNQLIVTGEKIFSKKINVPVFLNITNAPLLKGEQENFTFSYNSHEENGFSFKSNFNSYKTIPHAKKLNDAIYVMLEGQTRFKNRPPNSLTINTILNKDDSLDIQITDHDFLANKNARTFVTLEIYKKGLFGWDFLDKIIFSSTLELAQGEQSSRFKTDYKSDDKDDEYFIIYKVQRRGSDYYNSDFSVQKRTYPSTAGLLL